MARFTATVPLNLQFFGTRIEGPAGTVFEVPDSAAPEFGAYARSAIRGFAWVIEDEMDELDERIDALEGSGIETHPNLAEHDTLGLATQTELDAHEQSADPHIQYQRESQRGVADGYASLDSSGAVPLAQIPAAVALDSELPDLAGHVGDADPHTGYVREVDADWVELTGAGETVLHSHAGGGAHPNLATHDALGLATDTELTAAVSAHEAAGNPHPTYETSAEAAAKVTAHEALADPHTGYVREADANYVELIGAGETSLHSHAGGGAHPDLATHDSLGLATQAELDAHISDAADAHDASAISILDAAADFTATDVEGALAELQADHEADATALSDHIADAVDAHDASAISIADAGGDFTATTVEGALDELQADHEADATALSDHITDAAGAHAASAISILDTAADFTATDVEGALAELQSDNEAHVAAADPHTGYVREADANYVELIGAGETTLHSHAGGGAHPDLATHDALGLATDSELATHAADTTSVHGIADTSALETTSGAQGKVDTHAALQHGTVALVVAANDSSAAAKAGADYLCDGTADDVQIQAAWDALPSTGGTILLAPGTYAISATLLFDDNKRVSIEAYGAVFNLAASVTGMAIKQGISTSRGVMVFGLRIDGQSNASTIGFLLEDTNNSQLVGCEVENAAVSFDLHSNAASNFVEGCSLTDCLSRDSTTGLRFRTTSGTGSFMQTKVRGIKIVVGSSGTGIDVQANSLMLGAILEGSIWIGSSEIAVSLDGNMEDSEVDLRIEGAGGSTGNTAMVVGANASNVSGAYVRLRLTGTINTTLTNTGTEDFIYDSQRNVHIFTTGTQVEGWRRHGDSNNRFQIELLTAGVRLSGGTGGSAPSNLFTPSRGGTVLDPTGAINVIVWRAPFACTVTNVRGYRVGGTGATINARRNGSSNHLSSALSVTSADTWMDGGSVQNTAYAAGDKLEIMVVTVAGSPTQVAIQVDFTRP